MSINFYERDVLEKTFFFETFDEMFNKKRRTKTSQPLLLIKNIYITAKFQTNSNIRFPGQYES
jgi:hypothetical protein